MNRKILLTAIGFAAAFFFIQCAATKTSTIETTGQTPRTFQKEVTVSLKMDYQLYLPEDYNSADKRYPLVLFLHGAGERGTDINLVKKHGPPKLVDEGKQFPFIVVSPQCPEGLWWNMDAEIEALNQLLIYIQENYPVDAKRIYVTGLSMGGFGTWKLLEKYPDRFAAAMPICGGGDSTKACLFKDVPIWDFHGAKDPVVKIELSQKMINALEACGGKPKFTIYPEAGHDSWTETYNNPEVYEWMLNQVNGK